MGVTDISEDLRAAIVEAVADGIAPAVLRLARLEARIDAMTSRPPHLRLLDALFTVSRGDWFLTGEVLQGDCPPELAHALDQLALGRSPRALGRWLRKQMTEGVLIEQGAAERNGWQWRISAGLPLETRQLHGPANQPMADSPQHQIGGSHGTRQTRLPR